jgi:hypothetical protein
MARFVAENGADHQESEAGNGRQRSYHCAPEAGDRLSYNPTFAFRG